MKQPEGTPKNIDELVEHIVFEVTIGTADTMKDRTYAVVRDFLAQKFGAAYLKASDEFMAQDLENLFNELTKRGE